MRAGHGRRWRGRGFSRRAIRLLEPTLLLILHHGPAHGYAMLERCAQFGLADTDTSALYRALRDMELRGWVTSTWDEEQTQGPARRVYQLTALGDEVLCSWTEDVRETSQIIDHLLDVYTHHMEQDQDQHHPGKMGRGKGREDWGVVDVERR